MVNISDDPTAQFNTLLRRHASAIPYARHQARRPVEPPVSDVDPVERKSLVNEFERRALTTAFNIPLLWYQRIIVNNRKVKGWDLPASHFTGQSVVDVWLDDLRRSAQNSEPVWNSSGEVSAPSRLELDRRRMMAINNPSPFGGDAGSFGCAGTTNCMGEQYP